MSINATFRDSLTSGTTEQPNISLDETSLVVAGEDMENEQEGTEEIQEGSGDASIACFGVRSFDPMAFSGIQVLSLEQDLIFMEIFKILEWQMSVL